MRWLFLLFIVAICFLLLNMAEQVSGVASQVKYRAACQTDINPNCGENNVRQPR